MHAVEVPFGRKADLGAISARGKEKGESNIRNTAFFLTLVMLHQSSQARHMYDAKEIRSDRALKIIGWETQVVQGINRHYGLSTAPNSQ